MSRTLQIENLAIKGAEIEQAWERFDAAQAKIENEIRRPAQKIDVMSDEEYYRIEGAKTMIRNLAEKFCLLVETRNREIWDTVADFFTQALPAYSSSEDSDKTAASAIADILGDSFILYCQAMCDPYIHLDEDAASDDVILGYMELEFGSLFGESAHIIIEKVSDGYKQKYEERGGEGMDYTYINQACDAADARKAPSSFILDLIREHYNSEQRSTAEKALMKRFLDDTTLQQAFLALVTKLYLDNTAVQGLGPILSKLPIFQFEGFGPIPEELTTRLNELGISWG